MAHRIDSGSLKPPQRLKNGNLRVDALITRTGVFNYSLPNGTIRKEYRPPEEVFKEDSLASFSLVTVTDDHPPVMVTADNAVKYSVGTTGENPTRTDDDFVMLPMVIIHKPTIKKMDQGKVQVSCGYECDLDETPGVTPDGIRYDAIQRNIVANHVAIVEQGRMGPKARVRMDGVGQMVTDEELTQAIPDTDRGKEINKMELTEAVEKAVKATARADAADAKALEITKQLEALQGERDALKSALEKTEKARMDAEASVIGKVRARVVLEHKAAFLKTDLSAMSDREIKVAAIKHFDSVELGSDKSDDYVDARFDMSLERNAAAVESLSAVRGAVTQVKADEEDIETKARKAMHADLASKFKGVK